MGSKNNFVVDNVNKNPFFSSPFHDLYFKDEKTLKTPSNEVVGPSWFRSNVCINKGAAAFLNTPNHSFKSIWLPGLFVQLRKTAKVAKYHDTVLTPSRHQISSLIDQGSWCSCSYLNTGLTPPSKDQQFCLQEQLPKKLRYRTKYPEYPHPTWKQYDCSNKSHKL